MAAATLRILSDIHFGDRATRVRRLTQLRPLLDRVDHLVLNGDTLDTRPGPRTEHTAACRAEVMAFFPREVPRTRFITGNHDANLSDLHSLELADGAILVLHGDVLFDNIVPWGADVPLIERLLAQDLAAGNHGAAETLEQRLLRFRRVAAAVPQRHQSERNGWKYAASFLRDTAWPPTRFLEIFRAWRKLPAAAAQLVQHHRPRAKFVITGHTHRPGIWRMPPGVVVINTGSYCRPLGGSAVDVTEHALQVRRIVSRAGEFRAGEIVAEFPLAAS